MCRIKALITALLLMLGAVAARAADVVLALGDTESLPAGQAVRLLKADPALAGHRVIVLPSLGLGERERNILRGARIVLVQSVGRNLARAIAPEIPAIAAAGGKVFAVGATFDESFTQQGFARSEMLTAYMAAGGAVNIANMVRAALRDEGLARVSPSPPEPFPDFGAIDLDSGAVHPDFTAFAKASSRAKAGQPWVGLAFYRSNAVSGQLATLRALSEAIEKRGFNVIPFFGFPNEPTLERFGFDASGKPVLAALGALSLKISNNPATLTPLLKRLDVPVVNLIALNSQSRAQFLASRQGLDLMERSWQVGGAELGGLVAPTVVAGKERAIDTETGIETSMEVPMAERVERAAERLARWAALRAKPNDLKRVALIYFNYPPGKESIGASYLNVLPKSLSVMLRRMAAEGYPVTGMPPDDDALLSAIRDKGGNVGAWNKGNLAKLVKEGVKAGTIQLLPVSTYRAWLEKEIDPRLARDMIEKWGEPEAFEVMTWRDGAGVPYFVFPVQRYGNILLAPQPTRGWEQAVDKIYHDITLPPHHQYLAFYLWLQKQAGVDAMVHIGTHATHEWHSGREVGFAADDPGEIFTGAVPQLYPYIVDDIGEALQAKRRGMAAIISHLTPPLDKASLNPQLRELSELISNFKVAKEKSPELASGVLEEINKRARAQGLLKDAGLAALANEDDVEHLDDHIRSIAEATTPFGLHSFGVAPPEEMRRKTAEAILSVDPPPAEVLEAKTRALMEKIEASAAGELDAFMAGLSGRFIAPGPGNDPVRTPNSLPTGRNLYGFDPAKMPSPATWAMGEKLAQDSVADFKARKGEWPTRLVFNLWGVESQRHEGVMESQILALLGIKPQWDARGRISGVEVIPRAALARPRVDVTIIPSGLYRDLFPLLMQRLDEAVSLARDQDEADNPIRANVKAARAALEADGIAPERAAKLASLRLFSVPSGAYGTNLDRTVPLSNTYGKAGKETDEKLANLYFMRMHHAFGQGLWGESLADRPGLGVDLLRRALKGAQGVIHSRSSNIYGALDGDDFYQYLGGTALAMRAVNGKTPEVFVTNMANPKAVKNETLERYVGREIRARYLNPKWIEAMLKEGYSGPKMANHVVEHLYAWQVLVPEAIGPEKWQEFYETYVEDRNKLDLREKFRASGNLLAYQAMVDRMLVTINKGYWQPDKAVIEKIEALNRELIAEAGVACTPDTCSSPEVVAMARAQDQRAGEEAARQPAPGAAEIAAATALSPNSATPVPAGAPSSTPPQQEGQAASGARSAQASQQAQVTGQVMEEKVLSNTLMERPPPLPWLWIGVAGVFLAGFASRLKKGNLGFASRLKKGNLGFASRFRRGFSGFASRTRRPLA